MQQPAQRKSALGFARITADDARQQRERIAQQLAVQLAQHPPAPPLPQKRPVGRPKRQREAADVLTAAAAATAASAAATAPILPLDQPPSKRGKYTNWFTSPFLTDILAAYAHCHLTFSDNHWSSQKTMQQYVSEIIMPYAEACIRKHRLHADAHVILVLDVWSVHKSEEFRLFLRTHHPRIHLVFVPANCTSKLQVADVALQRPFKHAITRRFNEWAVRQIQEQIHADNVIGLAALLKMSIIKPLALQWCIDSWTVLKERRELITDAWQRCCVSLYNVMDPAKRIEAVAAVARQELQHTHVPDQDEEAKQNTDSEDNDDDDDSGDDSNDDNQDELDLTQPTQFGSRRGQRHRAPAATFGYQLDSSAIAMTEDSEH